MYAVLINHPEIFEILLMGFAKINTKNNVSAPPPFFSLFFYSSLFLHGIPHFVCWHCLDGSD